MAIGHFGPKDWVDNMKNGSILVPYGTLITDSNLSLSTIQSIDSEKLILQNKISELEYQLANQPPQIVEITKEVPVEVIKEIKVFEEKIIEKEIPVIHEKIVKEFIDRPVEVIREIDKEIIKNVRFMPKWVYCVLALQSLMIIILLFK